MSSAIEETKPARKFIAEAVPAGDGGFHAKWAAPGLLPAFVVNSDGSKRNFPLQIQAENSARREAFDALNRGVRVKNRSTPETYKRLTGDEFALALAEAGITPTFFAYLYGTSQDRVLKWRDGMEDVPHPVRILLEIFKYYPRSIDSAERVTEAVTQRRVRRTETAG